eukprot:2309850-Pyramimonas_sp.AAC.1
MLEERLKSANESLVEARRQVAALEQEAKECFARSLAKSDGPVLKLEEQQLGSASAEFREWFRGQKGDEKAAKHLEALFGMLEAQAVAARNGAVPPPA